MNDFSRPAAALLHLRQLLADDSSKALPELMQTGAELDRCGCREAALAAFEALAARGAVSLSLWHAIAALRLALGRPLVALDACDEAIGLAPDNPDALFNKAVALESLKENAQASSLYQRVLEIDGAYRGALLNQVSLLLSEKRLDDALRLSEVAILAHPSDADCWFNHGEVMTTLSRHGQALDAYQQALSLEPACSKAIIASAVAMAALGRLKRAGELLAQVSGSDPNALRSFRSPIETDRASDYPELEPGRIALIAAYQRFRACDWTVRDDFIDLFQSVVDGRACKPMNNPDLPFLGIGLPLPGDCRRRAASQVAQRIAAEMKGVSLVRKERNTGPDASRLRIAYISGDIRQHATAFLMSRLPGLHDRKLFEVFVYSTGPDDQSEMRNKIVTGADHFRDVARFDARATAQRIALDGIDILVDLSGYTLFARSAALALRPAPVQVSYLGYLPTSGAPWMDYAVLDRVVLGESERSSYSESIAYLPHTLYLCDDRLTSATLIQSRSDVGLPKHAFVFCCLNASWKIDPDTFACWMAILKRIPDSVLWLYGDIPEACDNLRTAVHRAGVAAQRIVFAQRVSHEEHLARFRLADVFLDTFLCNGHTTTIEALGAGVPVITLPGETVVSRVAASLLTAHGVTETIANTREAYVEMACQLAEDDARLTAIRNKLKERSGSRLFCTERRVRELEAAYTMMWERHRSGRPAQDFDVVLPSDTA